MATQSHRPRLLLPSAAALLASVLAPAPAAASAGAAPAPVVACAVPVPVVACAVRCAALAGPPAAQDPTSLDRLAEVLRERTRARREAATTAWKERGAAYLSAPDEAQRAALADFAPEIQGPVLSALRSRLEGEEVPEDEVRALAQLLAEVINASGADRLADLLESLPPAVRLECMPALARKGGLRSQRALQQHLDARDRAIRNAALLALLRHGQGGRCAGWLAEVPPREMNTETRQRVLNALAERELPAAFRLPAPWFALDDSKEVAALVGFLAAHPDEEVEDLVTELVLDRNRPVAIRETGLQVIEHGAEAFRWRTAKRKLGAILRSEDGDPLAEPTAWTLHRLGEKAGARWLLEAPEEEVKDNENNYRAHLRLGEMQVRVGEFRDAFRSYEEAMRLADLYRGRLSAQDYLYASRAAAGARKSDEAGEWLAKTRMSPAELAPYRDLPEFADLLDDEPFTRLFGSP